MTEERVPDVSPYRILQRIGSGGMGEVFLAADDRLRRRVAIKRIRPDRDLGEGSRTRLLREARYAAGLSHPALVAVHDVLERDDAVYVVMEWVDGVDLRSRVREKGPLPIPEVIALARHMAGGLAEAHRQGIVHRDLKAENILIDRHGRPKITDFGIAKRVSAELEESLTAQGMVVGTYRIMSPEQALCESVDQRSDLFSFGVLLFEILTEETPFGEASHVETLRRILETEPKDVTLLRPDTPSELATLIRRLLEKDPNLRPRSAHEVERALCHLEDEDETLEREHPFAMPDGAAPDGAPPAADAPTSDLPAPASESGSVDGERRSRWLMSALLAILAVASLFLLSRGEKSAPSGTSSPAKRSPIYIAPLAPELRIHESAPKGEGLPEIFSEAVHVAVVRALISLESVSAKAIAEVDKAGGDMFQVARSLSADEVLASSILWNGSVGHVTLRRLRVSDQVTVWNDSLEIPTDELLVAMRAVAGLTRRAFPDHETRPGFPGLVTQSADLRRFLEIRSRFLSRVDAKGDETLEQLDALRRTSPRFIDIDLLTVEAALHRFYDSRDPLHLRRAEEAIERAEGLAPRDPRVLRHRVYVELEAGRLPSAQAALDELQQTLPGDVAVQDLRARLWRREGRSAEAAELMRWVADRFPSTRRLVRLARFEIDLGRIDSARRHLETALKNSPESFESLSLLAQLELTVGDASRAIEHYERLVARSPGASELSNLGLGLMLLGRYETAVERFEQALSSDPRNPFFTLNLADAIWLAGDSELAKKRYLEVIDQIHEDEVAGRVQFVTVEAQALAHLGRHREAIDLVQQAVRQAPGSGNVAYEACLVYTLAGQMTSAMAQAEAALHRGFEPRWFNFPWFDALRETEGFEEMVGTRPDLG